MARNGEVLKHAIGKAAEFILGGLGGWLAGMLVAAEGVGAQIFYYHEGWYKAFGAYLLIPLFVTAAYIFFLPSFAPKYRWYIAPGAALPVLILFLMARALIPPSGGLGVIEFVAFWTFIAQLTSTILLGVWHLAWQLRKEFHLFS